MIMNQDVQMELIKMALEDKIRMSKNDGTSL